MLTVGTICIPKYAKFLLNNLQKSHVTSFSEQKYVCNLVVHKPVAVYKRKIIFEPLNLELTKLRKS